MTAQDAAWRRWLEGLADARSALVIERFGQVRATSWDMGSRVLDEHMLHYVVAGGQVGEVGGVGVRTRRESLLWVPPGVPQTLRMDPAQRRFAKYYLRFRIDGVSPPPGQPAARDALPGAYALFARLYDELAADLPGREANLRALLVLIFGEWRRAQAPAGQLLSEAQRARLLALVDADPAARPNPARLARELGMSPTWFARCFRRTYGEPPRGWLMRHRIRSAAQRLLEHGGPIGEVAAEHGYPDLFLFSRQFKAVLGASPRAWRSRGGR